MASGRTPPPEKDCQKRTSLPYKGVRMRTWGRWVAEIWIPITKERLWLGSYDAPEKAARAYDAAQYCFCGPEGRFNFPADERPELPYGLAYSLSKHDVKAIAANFASQDPPMPSPVFSSVTTQALPDTRVSPDLVVSSEIRSANRLGGVSLTPANVMGTTPILPENIELDDFMMNFEWMEDFF
ncbi:hypothetical protein L1049_018836 [Liquidambar formosana]|uniref:AP2/ERF domain-containing protein n=1 Tax=Liquidambar formosana TaxID=63359 RepID=A0AAP0RBK3_LIQFO